MRLGLSLCLSLRRVWLSILRASTVIAVHLRRADLAGDARVTGPMDASSQILCLDMKDGKNQPPP